VRKLTFSNIVIKTFLGTLLIFKMVSFLWYGHMRNGIDNACIVVSVLTILFVLFVSYEKTNEYLYWAVVAIGLLSFLC